MFKFCLAILISIFSITFTFSCECVEFSYSEDFVEYQFASYQIVFIGKLIYRKNDSFSLKVIEDFKGTKVDEIYNGRLESSCSLIPNEKGNWIIYANLIGDSYSIDLSSCSFSRSLITNGQILIDRDTLTILSNIAMKTYGTPLAEFAILASLKSNSNLTKPYLNNNEDDTKSVQKFNFYLFVIMIISLLLFIGFWFKYYYLNSAR